MPHLSLLVLLLASLLVRPAAGQEAAPLPPVSADSLARVERDAREAAGLQPIAGYFAGALLGGLPLGLVGPVAAAYPTPVTVGIAGGGLGVVVLVLDRASDRGRKLPDPVEARLRSYPPEYQGAFRTAYVEQVVKRRRRAGGWGAGVGIGAGVGMLGWTIWSFSHSDF